MQRFTHQWFPFIVLALTTWLAHFFYFRDFGLYEDDYLFVADALKRSPDYLIAKLHYFISWPEGRPVGFYLASLFSFLGDHLAGLPGCYLIGFLIVTLNSCLFYLILKRISSPFTAIIGSLAFCLFPADTTKILLTHAFILQTSLTFFLLATLAYLSDKKILAYSLIAGSLLSYESAFVIFFGVPLLKPWNKKLPIELVKNTLVLIALIAIAALTRLFLGEGRAVQASTGISSIPIKVLNSMLIGSNTSLRLFFKTPFQAISEWNYVTGAIAALSAFLLFLALKRIRIKFVDKVVVIRNSSLLSGEIDEFYLKSLKLLVSGLVLLSLSYSLSFTFVHYPPDTEYGRLTSENLAATVGGSIVFSSLVSLGIYLAHKYQILKFSVVILSSYFAVLVAYHFTIQQDFQRSWQYQREFWTGIVSTCPDVTPNTIIFMENNELNQTKYILTHTAWAEPIIIKQLYQFPQLGSTRYDFSQEMWRPNTRPVFFLIGPHWQRQIDKGQEVWQIDNQSWPGLGVGDLSSSKVILLRVSQGKFSRVLTSLPDHIQPGKPVKEALPSQGVIKGALFDYLIN